jgi:HPr kinase/phosphorylase
MQTLENIQILRQDKIPVSVLMESHAGLSLINNTGLDNNILFKSLFRPQLALSGFVDSFAENSVLIFGNTEIEYLNSLEPDKKIEAINHLLQFHIPCIIITNSHKLDSELLKIVTDNNIAVFSTALSTEITSYALFDLLDDQFADQAVLHGSFVDVYGVGMLFVGRSGIGKSEIALDLIERGHRLVADDVAMFTKKRETVLMGTGTNLVRHFMEIRGLGIIDIRQMFGIRAIRFQKRLEIIVVLQEYNPNEDYTRIGLDENETDIMGVKVSTVNLPIFPGKNITVIAEVIAVNYLLRTYGYNAAMELSDRLQDEISKKTTSKIPLQYKRAVPYIHPDDE